MDMSVWFVMFGVFLVVTGATHGLSDGDTSMDSEEDMIEMLENKQQFSGVTEDHLLKTVLSLLRHNLQRHTRDPSVLHHPQRFGRGSRTDVRSEDRMNPQDGAQIWSLAVPQRFGKK